MRVRPAFRALVAAGAAVMSAAATGCSAGAGPGTPAAIRAGLARDVLTVTDRHGVPLDLGWVGCDGPDPSGEISCHATTAYEPAGDVAASFSLQRRQGSCPGLLRVSIDDSPLATVPADPCR